MVEVVPPVDGGVELVAAVARLADFRWVVLTSVSGVRALAAALAGYAAELSADYSAEYSEDAAARPWPAGTEVMPVGPATAEAARLAGFATVAPPPVATARDLVAAFPKPDPDPGSGPVRVLAPLAELAGDTVEVGLQALGYDVERITAYRTAAPATAGAFDRRSIEAADAVTFFSPSAVERFVERYGPDVVPPVVVCIGPSTTARAAGLGLSATTQAEPHTGDGVVAALIDSLSRTR
jgi:uroporphyrinogen-III synthase